MLVDPPLNSNLAQAIYYETESPGNAPDGPKILTRRTHVVCQTANASIPSMPTLYQYPPAVRSCSPEKQRLKFNGYSMLDDLERLLTHEANIITGRPDLDVALPCCRMVMARTAVDM